MISKIKLLALAVIIATFGVALNSCETEQIAVQEKYDFTVTHLADTLSLAYGKTSTISFEISSMGNYKENYFTICFNQPTGTGIFVLDDDTVLTADTKHTLENNNFVLYYTAKSYSDQVFEITIEDSFSQTYTATFNIEYERSGR